MGSIGLYDESVELYGEECWVTWWVLFGSTMGSVGLCGGECCVTWWGVLSNMMGVLSDMVDSIELHGGVLGYMVECWVIW